MNRYELKRYRDDDLEFLFNLLKSSMIEYYKTTFGYWNDEEELRYLKESLSKSKYEIIYVENLQIGCLALQESQNSIFLEEIQLLPSMQNKGLGSKIIKDLIERAIVENKEIHLEVLKSNTRAFKLYKRYGFSKIGENETHFKLTYTIAPKGTTSNSE